MTVHRIEILGPSGLGKSTALAGALRILAAEGTAPGLLGPRAHHTHHEQTYATRPLEERRLALEAPAFTAISALALDIAGRMKTTPATRLLILEVFVSTLRRAVSALQMPCAVLVHDELLLQRAFSFLALSATPEADTRDWFALVPLPEAAVLCLAPPEVILARYTARGLHRLSHGEAGQDVQAATVDRMVACCDIAAEVLSSRGVRLHQLDLSGPPEAAAQALALVLRAEAARLA